MKKSVLLGILLLGFLGNAQPIQWMTLNEALVAQKENPKKS